MSLTSLVLRFNVAGEAYRCGTEAPRDVTAMCPKQIPVADPREHIYICFAVLGSTCAWCDIYPSPDQYQTAEFVRFSRR